MFLRLFSKCLWPERFLPEPARADLAENSAPSCGASRVGVLLVNLGTPDNPLQADIRRYLAEFLADPRVIELPRYLWLPLLHGLVLTRRPKKLVPRYAGIWMEEGSPLLVYSRRQADALRASLGERGMQVQVELGMRYGNPSLTGALERLRQAGCEYILTVPLYPQYAASTTATVVDAVTRYARRLRDQPALRFIKRFYDESNYIAALAESVQTYWQAHGMPQKLVISFHGLPQYVVQRGDPYYHDCQATARLLIAKLGLMPEQAEVTFQSRFGAARWLEPYTESRLKELAVQGVTKVDVICPGFVADCLETLEEINQECRQAFLSAGGTHFGYIPALNASASWTSALTQLVENHLQGWPTCRAADA